MWVQVSPFRPCLFSSDQRAAGPQLCRGEAALLPWSCLRPLPRCSSSLSHTSGRAPMARTSWCETKRRTLDCEAMAAAIRWHGIQRIVPRVYVWYRTDSLTMNSGIREYAVKCMRHLGPKILIIPCGANFHPSVCPVHLVADAHRASHRACNATRQA